MAPSTAWWVMLITGWKTGGSRQVLWKSHSLAPTDAVGWMRLADCYERMDEPCGTGNPAGGFLSAPNSTELN
jgi:hypothetical protein